MTTEALALPLDYAGWLADLKQRIHGARQRALLAANGEQIRLYHHIGLDIVDRQSRQGWGAKVIDRLSADLRAEFPEMKGLSASNLKYMRFFAQECPDGRIGQRTVDQLPWGHLITILTKLEGPALRGWYAEQALARAWSRDLLAVQIRDQLHRREGAAITNFDTTLAPDLAGAAANVLKDPYHFDFLGLGPEAHERDIEGALIRHVTRFLLELGAGFAFVGRQVRIEVAGEEFFVDLLLYHTRLHCYVVVELKAQAFKPEHAGQLNFYLTAVDAQLRTPGDQATVGLLLCRSRNRVVAEYALSRVTSPIGVAEYQLLRSLPQPLDTSLPSIEEIEAGLSGDLGPEEGDS